jgi:hypothetical protein
LALKKHTNTFAQAMKHLAVIILVIAFAAQTFNRATVVASYYANTTAYAKNCINKAKPLLQCHGKCQMMKKLKEEEKKDQQNTERKSSLNEFISCKSFFATLDIAIQRVPTNFINHNSGTPIDTPRDFFHPPSS